MQAAIGLMLRGVALCALPWLVAVVPGLALFTLGFFAAQFMIGGFVG